ncbi:DoxX family protein [Pseudooceanicola nanhaiensis]|uniref:DoxX family protein n=1 Tax=Pseudooceanicola nanhaiensis TaxID=375761 RepID=UPI004058126D
MTRFARLAAPLDRLDPGLPLFARIIFAAVLLRYFWASALTKVGDGPFGLFTPSTGAYAQIFPRQFEAVGYDTAQLGLFHWAVVTAGTWAEFLLPLAIVLGLFTRIAALGMIGFVAVQSLTDLYGHGGIAHAETLGALFDRAPDGVILDQRLLWAYLLVVLVVKGGGWLSADRLIAGNAPSARPAAPRPAP